MRRKGTCAYCGKSKKVTSDHVPPKGLFAKPRPNLITVPACERCHSSQCARDDEYFRLTLTLSEQSGDHTDAAAGRASALRSLVRPEGQGLRRAFANEIRWFLVQSQSGVFTRRLGFSVDLERLFRVVERTVRGLYYHEQHRPMDSSDDVIVHSNDTLADWNRELLEELRQKILAPLAALPAQVIGDKTFAYRFACPERDGVVLSAWALTFYGEIPFLAMTGPARADLDLPR
jgi:hypothetical protein